MLKSLFIQAVVFLAIFQALTMFRESDMLSTGEQITPQTVSLETLDDKTIELANFKKTTIIYFFAPWCQICHISISNLQETYENNQQINVIAIALDYVDKKEVFDFSSQHQLTFPIALGTEQIKHQFKIEGYPSYYVIDDKNTVIAKSMGYSSEIGLFLRTL
ncbi:MULTISPECIES: TlpA disulfide reductase family protein [unclassified Colwellia]|uniref:TlpA family protein disulfide reductase n=1 Tax=unclassified Colwellia TaxID=196834 RepID=UPI0028731BB5|nr:MULTISPECIES: TlpA disulfide reductase family protein [unclassified Colwellia]